MTHVAFAFLAMGAWAGFINHTHGVRATALAFVIQGALSGFITLVLKKGLEAAYRRIPGPAGRIVPPIVSALTIGALLFCAHTLAGTPEVLKTIAVPWSVSTLYGFIYVFTLPPRAG